jgi:hypothetical protein
LGFFLGKQEKLRVWLYQCFFLLISSLLSMLLTRVVIASRAKARPAALPKYVYSFSFRSETGSRGSRNSQRWASTSAIHREGHSIDVPKINVAEHVLKKSKGYGKRPALIDSTSGRSISFEELPSRVAYAQEGLKARGIGVSKELQGFFE